MSHRALSWLARSAAALCACARADAGPQALAPVDPAELRPTSGTLERTSASTFTIEDASFRAELGDLPRDSAEIAFVYRGPTRRDAPLASGELRRQIGLKLRAKDTCNVVYVMWHIEPSRGIEVSVKSNPGQATHEACADRGYTFNQAGMGRRRRERDPRRESARHRSHDRGRHASRRGRRQAGVGG